MQRRSLGHQGSQLTLPLYRKLCEPFVREGTEVRDIVVRLCNTLMGVACHAAHARSVGLLEVLARDMLVSLAAEGVIVVAKQAQINSPATITYRKQTITPD